MNIRKMSLRLRLILAGFGVVILAAVIVFFIVILGEAAMLTAQLDGKTKKPFGMNVPGIDNRQLALNIMHWLSKIL